MKTIPSLTVAVLLPLLLINGYNLTASTNNVMAGQELLASSQGGVAVMLDRVLADPQQYLDKEIIVEGVLVAPDKGFYRRFFLQGKDGTTLEVWPWAPFEIYQPPSPKEPPTIKPMRYFVGRHLRLTGRLQKHGEGFIFKVSSVEEF